MSGPGPLSPACSQADPWLVELALGQLAGEDREAVLGHVEGCARCSAEVEALAGVADELLSLAPEVEPPAGFEGRVVGRFAPPSSPAPVGKSGALGVPGRPGRQGRGGRLRPARVGPGAARARVLAAAAVVALVVGAGGYAAGGGFAGRPAPPARSVALGPALQAASFVSHGQAVGRVLVYAGNPTWLFMWVDNRSWQGGLQCQVVQEGGPVLTLGRFWLSGGRGAWAASVGQPAGRLVEARLVGPAGKVVAVARLA